MRIYFMVCILDFSLAVLRCLSATIMTGAAERNADESASDPPPIPLAANGT